MCCDGLGIANNERLWILRCAMDVHGAHIAEWADVLQCVEDSVKAYIKDEGLRVRDFNGNSLEKLAKETEQRGVDISTRITYLPSRQVGTGTDGHLIRLRRNKPDLFRQVVSRKITMTEARRKAGMPVLTYMAQGRTKLR